MKNVLYTILHSPSTTFKLDLVCVILSEGIAGSAGEIRVDALISTESRTKPDL